MALVSVMDRSSLTWHCQLQFVSIFTTRYLALSVRYSLLPHNFIFKSTFKFLLLRFKDYHFSFFMLGEILFAFNQLARCFKSALTSLFKFLIELLRQKISVISKVVTLQAFITLFFYKKTFYKKMSLKNPKTLRKCYENLL